MLLQGEQDVWEIDGWVCYRPRADERARKRSNFMRVTFPFESAEYRSARDRLLEQEIELRRATEAVAAARRELPPGGTVPEDYVFEGAGADGASTDVKLSELFAPGKDSLMIYSFMFPRSSDDGRPGPEAAKRRSSAWRRALARRARPYLTSSIVPRCTPPSASTWWSPRRPRCPAS